MERIEIQLGAYGKDSFLNRKSLPRNIWMNGEG